MRVRVSVSVPVSVRVWVRVRVRVRIAQRRSELIRDLRRAGFVGFIGFIERRAAAEETVDTAPR